MPQSAGVFIAWAAGQIVSGLTAIGLSQAAALFVVDVGLKLTGLAFLGFVSKKLAPGVPDFASSARGKTITTRQTLAHQRIIYGEALASGPLVYMNVRGTQNQVLDQVVALAGHEVDHIGDIWLDNHEIPEGYIDDWESGGSAEQGNSTPVNSGDWRGDTAYQSPVRFSKRLGTDSDQVFLALSDNYTEIDSSFNGKGIAKIHAHFAIFEGQEQVWERGRPQNLKGLVRGKKVYNPNSDSTRAWGTGPHRVNSAATYEWTNNPALIWADYAIDSDLGFGEDPERVDWGYVASAAAVCSEHVVTPVGSQARFTCNGVLTTGETYEENFEAILSSFNGTMHYDIFEGTWKVRAFEYATPGIDLTNDNLRSGENLEIQLTSPDDERYNTVRGYFIDPNRLWEASQFPEVSDSAYVARDNSETIYRDIQLPMTTDPYEAQRLGIGVLNQSDLQTSIIFPSNFKSIRAEVGGTVTYTNSKMGWDQQPFRVMGYKIRDLQGLDLVLRIDSESAYTDPTTPDYSTNSGGTYAVTSLDVGTPNSFWVVSRNYGVECRVSEISALFYDQIVFYAASTNSRDQAEEIGRTRSDMYEHRIETPREYYYWCRAITRHNIVSDWVPNSDQTDRVAGAARFDTGALNDWTFDLSPDLTEFYTAGAVVDSDQLYIGVGSGENSGDNALIMAKEYSPDFDANKPSISVNRYDAIRGNIAKFKIRYKVSSLTGPDSNDAYISPYLSGYRPYSVTSTDLKGRVTTFSGYQSVYVGSYTQLPRIMVGSLDLSGDWATLVTTQDISPLIDQGATVVRAGLKIDGNTDVVQNNWGAHLSIAWWSYDWADIAWGALRHSSISNSSGIITVQSGGSPSGGSDGDITLIY